MRFLVLLELIFLFFLVRNVKALEDDTLQVTAPGRVLFARSRVMSLHVGL